MRHGSVVPLLAALVSLLPITAPTDESKRTLDDDAPRHSSTVLPTAVSRYLGAALPGYRPATANDYDAGWFDAESEWNAFDNSWFNWVVRGDFDGNGATDYALLMLGAESDELRTALVVVRATKSGWVHDVLESWKATADMRSAIYTAPPGRYSIDLADEPHPEVKPRFSTSLFHTATESCGLVHHFWEKGGWKQAYVGL